MTSGILFRMSSTVFYIRQMLWDLFKHSRFKVDFEEIGRPYKVRVFHDGKGMASGWHLDKVWRQLKTVIRNYFYKVHVYQC